MDSVLEFLRTPPGWLATLLVAYLMTHLLKIALKMPQGGVIGVLEFFAVVVVGGLMVHSFLGPEVTAARTKDHQSVNPTFFIVLFVVLTLASAVVFIVDKKTTSA
jgi:hypothetical protein